MYQLTRLVLGMLFVQLIDYIASKGKPVLMATGASTMEEITEAVNIIKI